MLDLRKYIKFLDYNLLREVYCCVVRNHANPDLVRKIESYETSVKNFCEQTSISNFVRSWKGSWKVPENFAELKVKLNLNPNESTLHELQEYGKDLWRKVTLSLKPRLIECAMIFHGAEPGSVYASWLIPSEIVAKLNFKTNECNQFLIANKFLKVMIDDRVFYSYEGKRNFCCRKHRLKLKPNTLRLLL